jgi:hypothetical protein
MSAESSANPSNPPGEPEWLGLVRDHVRGLRFGVVQLVVHDGRVTQIERTEKTRLTQEHAERRPRPPAP